MTKAFVNWLHESGVSVCNYVEPGFVQKTGLQVSVTQFATEGEPCSEELLTSEVEGVGVALGKWLGLYRDAATRFGIE